MKSKIDNWMEKSGANILRHVGIIKGHKVLDFGCGSGNYTIPAAKVVGEQGVVYVIDEDKEDLNQLMNKAKSMGLKNIIKIKASGKSEIALSNESVDVVLLYDILHYYYFPKEVDRRHLLSEVCRVLKPNGLLSLYPTHLEPNMVPKLGDVKREIKESNFREESEYPDMIMIHEDRIEDGCVINFRKENPVVR